MSFQSHWYEPWFICDGWIAEKRFEDFKYDITPNGLAEFIKEVDIDVVDDKFSYHGREFMMLIS